MKTIRNLILVIGLMLISFNGYSQATDVAEVRIANATTTFDRNLPIGTKVYDINTGDYFVATAGILSTLTLTTGSASFTQLNGGGTQNLTLGTITATTMDVNIDGGGTNATLIEATTTDAGLLGSDKWDEIVANTAKTGNVSTALSTGTVTATTYGITSDGGADDVVLVEATTTVAGLLGADKWDEIVANTAKATNVSTDLSLGTRTATTMDVNSSDGDNVTLLAANTTQAGLMTEAQFDKLAAIAAGAEVNYTSSTEKFEENDGTPTAHTLANTALTAQKVVVSLNGAVLDPANYTLATGTITIANLSVVQYDQVIITYFYQ